jgi:peptidoglycan hydrolase-like protein with peptidoglycan-binding domain
MPSSNLWDGSESGLIISKVSAPGEFITFQVGSTQIMPGTLKMGSKGSAVKAVQCILKSTGISPTLAIDGVFGLKTKNAVIAFQKSKGLVQDGIVGPKTWAALLDMQVLKTGSKGPAVKTLQCILNAAGTRPALLIDGIFGVKTNSAVIAIQKAHGLVQDGIVGPKTWNALMKYLAA